MNCYLVLEGDEYESWAVFVASTRAQADAWVVVNLRGNENYRWLYRIQTVTDGVPQ